MASSLQSSLQTALAVRNMLEGARDKQRQLKQQQEERDYLNYQRQLQHDQMIATDIINYTSNFNNANNWINKWLADNPGKTSQEGLDAWKLHVGELSDMVNTNMGKYGFAPKDLYVDFTANIMEDFSQIMAQGYELQVKGIDASYLWAGLENKYKNFMPAANTIFSRQTTEQNLVDNQMAAAAAAAVPAPGQGQPSGQEQPAPGPAQPTTPGAPETARPDTLAIQAERDGTTEPKAEPIDKEKVQRDIALLEKALPKQKDAEKQRTEERLAKLKGLLAEADKQGQEKSPATGMTQEEMVNGLNAVDRGINAGQIPTEAAPAPAPVTPDYLANGYNGLNEMTEQTAAATPTSLGNTLASAFQSMQARARADRQINQDNVIRQNRKGDFTLGSFIRDRVNDYGIEWFDRLSGMTEEQQNELNTTELLKIMDNAAREGSLTTSEMALWRGVVAEHDINGPKTQAFIQQYVPYMTMDDNNYFKQDNSRRQWQKIEDAKTDKIIKAFTSIDTKSIENPAVIANWINAVADLYGVDKPEVISDFIVVMADKATSDILDKNLQRKEMEAKIRGMEINNQYAAQLKELAIQKLDADISLTYAKMNDLMNGGNGSGGSSGGSGGTQNTAQVNGYTVPDFVRTGGKIGPTVSSMSEVPQDYVQYMMAAANYIQQNPGKTPKQYVADIQKIEPFNRTAGMNAAAATKFYNNVISILRNELGVGK